MENTEQLTNGALIKEIILSTAKAVSRGEIWVRKDDTFEAAPGSTAVENLNQLKDEATRRLNKRKR